MSMVETSPNLLTALTLIYSTKTQVFGATAIFTTTCTGPNMVYQSITASNFAALGVVILLGMAITVNDG